MRVLKTKTFARWSRKERVRDASLVAAVDEIRRGLVDAHLGGGLVKKNERDNVDDEELSKLKSLAQAYIGMGEDTIGRLIRAGELMEVKHGESQTS